MQPRVDLIALIAGLLDRRGGSMYGGEAVTQKAHALQCAWMAEREGAGDALVVAALLHDVGHLLNGFAVDVPASDVDLLHEEAGQEWLSHFFGPEVTEPVRLHVAAKRYLCAREPLYHASLSAASRASLSLQGGVLPEEELRTFAEQPFAGDALRLRRWDDRAKTPGLDVPGLAHYVARIRALERPDDGQLGTAGVL